MSILLHDISFPPEGEDAIGLFLRWDRTVHLWRPRAFVGHDVEATELLPHGGLIDKAELWVEINKICDRRDAGIITDLACLQQILSVVRHAPTIIPAEEK